MRAAREEDLPLIMELDRLSFDEPWDYYNFKATLEEIFLVYEAESVAGYIIACCCRLANRAMILRLAVHPEYRCKGIATVLLEETIKQLRARGVAELELDVDIMKRGAVHLYEKVGFRVARMISPQEDEDESFFVMRMDLM